MSAEARGSYLTLDEVREVFGATDWMDLLPRVVLFAVGRLDGRSWRGIKNGPRPQGVSPEDLAQAAVLKLLTGERRWRRGQDLLEALCQIVSSSASNLARSKDNRSVRRVDSSATSSLRVSKGDVSDCMSTEEEYRRQRSELLRLAADDPLLLKLATYLIDEDAPTAAAFAEEQGIPVTDVYNAKKRLRRRFRHLDPASFESDADERGGLRRAE